MYILLISLVLILLSLTYIKICIVFHRVYEDDVIQIKLLLLFGLIKLNFKIPYLDLAFNEKNRLGIKTRAEVKSKGKTLSKRKEHFNLNELKLMYDKVSKLYKEYREVLDYLVSKMKMDNFKWNTEIGLEDAAVTAISTGVLWSIKGSIMTILSERVNINNIELNVVPNYNKLIFEAHLDCIIRIKIANIIITGIKAANILMKNTILKKGGEINEPASYRRTNENHNG